MSTSVNETLNRCLFFFGAGATQEAGCYTSPQMLSDLQEKYSDGPKKEALDFLMSCLAYHSTWKSCKQKNFRHDPNIEELVLLLRRIVDRDSYLPYPITGSWSDKINVLEAKEDAVFDNLLKDIEGYLKEWVRGNNPLYDYLTPLTQFLKDYTNEQLILDMFTLNYDLVFENHFNSDSETLLSYGFSNGKWVGFSERSKGGENERIFYYKIHGSLNWCKLDDGSIWERNYVPEDYEGDITELMIFGYGNKFLSIDPFLSLTYEFCQNLKEKDYLIVIGYSFFDPYINNLLFEAVSQSNGDKKLIIVNPWALDKYEDQEEVNGESDFQPTQGDLKSLSEKLKVIQQSHFLSDLPDFNVYQVAFNLLKIIPLKTGRFLNDYFGNRGKKLIELIDQLMKESKEQNKVFD